MNKKLIILLGILVLLVGINLASAGLCRGYNGYHDCNPKSYKDNNYNVPFNYGYKSSYINYDGYNYESRSKYYREHNSVYGYYSGKYYEEINYNINRYYPYYSYKTSRTYKESNWRNNRYVEESYVNRKLSYPEAYLVLWTYR